MIELPYELIGRLVVYGLIVIASAVVIGAVLFALAWVWVRTWLKVVNLMWRGYDPRDEAPEGIRRKVAIVAWGLAHFKRPSDVHEAIQNAHELER